MTKLTEAQEKRFDEKFLKDEQVSVPQYDISVEAVKQFLADELERQKNEILEGLKESKPIKDMTNDEWIKLVNKGYGWK